ncbi:MAG: hypothetical protein VB092_06235 [Oscillospiraceae bacterium]|nr:hypothetical protein [Oscillospiraceae bacterium]
MNYTELLQLAQIAALKQKYLDAVDEARAKLQEQEETYRENAQSAYVDAQQKRRVQPQKLRAAGLSGGAETEATRGIEYDYENAMRKLKNQRQSDRDDYAREADKQSRLMDNALDVYNARAAKASAKTSTKTSAKKNAVSADDAADSTQDVDFVGQWRKKIPVKNR